MAKWEVLCASVRRVVVQCFFLGRAASDIISGVAECPRVLVRRQEDKRRRFLNGGLGNAAQLIGQLSDSEAEGEVDRRPKPPSSTPT